MKGVKSADVGRGDVEPMIVITVDEFPGYENVAQSFLQTIQKANRLRGHLGAQRIPYHVKINKKSA